VNTVANKISVHENLHFLSNITRMLPSLLGGGKVLTLSLHPDFLKLGDAAKADDHVVYNT